MINLFDYDCQPSLAMTIAFVIANTFLGEVISKLAGQLIRLREIASLAKKIVRNDNRFCHCEPSQAKQSPKWQCRSFIRGDCFTR